MSTSERSVSDSVLSFVPAASTMIPYHRVFSDRYTSLTNKKIFTPLACTLQSMGVQSVEVPFIWISEYAPHDQWLTVHHFLTKYYLVNDKTSSKD